MIPGEVVEPLPEGHLPAAGELLAKLHNCPPTGLDLPVATRRLNAAQRAVVKDFPDRAFADWITRQLDTITRREATHQRTPVPAHGDLFADNIIVQPTGDLSVIDWETVSLDDPLLDVGMAAVGLCQDAAAHLSTTRLGLFLDGYNRLRPLSGEDLTELPTEIIHAAVIIGFHRYYRHSVRYPDPSKASYHLPLVDFADSVPPAL